MRSILACLAQGFIPGFKRRTGFIPGERGNKREDNAMRERPQRIQVFILEVRDPNINNQ
jgi:hypothetical protein